MCWRRQMTSRSPGQRRRFGRITSMRSRISLISTALEVWKIPAATQRQMKGQPQLLMHLRQPQKHQRTKMQFQLSQGAVGSSQSGRS